ncbi:unnamed protein product [Sympodiomycopsis kandeliae]
MAPKPNAYAALLQQQQCQSIYSALDSGNTRQAIQAADKVLQTNTAKASHPLARALKALALHRLGKRSEAVQEAEAALSSGSTDSIDITVLTPITFVLSRNGQEAKVAQVLDTVSKSRPQDSELAVKAFEALIQNKDYLKAQQLATRLAKLPSPTGSNTCSSRRNLHFWWSIECYFLLHTETPDAQGAQLALTLALRLIERHISDKNGAFDQKSDQDIELYVRILLAQAEKDQQNKQQHHQKALQLLTTSPGREIVKRSLGLSQLYMDVLVITQEWRRLQQFTQEQIAAGDRNWITIEKYIQAVVEQTDTNVHKEAVEFISSLAEKDGNKKRDFPLAEMFLHHEMRKLSLRLDADQGLVSLLDKYFISFKRKACCYEDLLPYVDSLSPGEQKEFLQLDSLRTLDVTDRSISVPAYDSEDVVVSSVNATKLRARLLAPESDDIVSTIEALLQAFYTSVPISSKQAKTIPRPGSDFLLMASQLILSQSRSTITVILLLSILTQATTSSTPASYSLKLLSMRLYLLLNHWKLAKKIWTDDLGIKNIQYESLSWLWLCTDQENETLSEWLQELREFYKESDVSIIKPIMIAFERGNYSSIGEFIDMQKRLKGSLQRRFMDKNDDGKQERWCQWDCSVLPSFYPRLKSIVDLTDKVESVNAEQHPLEWLKLHSLSGLQFDRYKQLVKQDTSSPEQLQGTHKYLSDHLLQDTPSSLDTLLSHIKSRLSEELLPWEELHLFSILFKLNSTSEKESTRTISLEHLDTTLDQKLNTLLDGQKGGIGVKEKVVKDVKEEYNKMVKKWNHRFKGLKAD